MNGGYEKEGARKYNKIERRGKSNSIRCGSDCQNIKSF